MVGRSRIFSETCYLSMNEQATRDILPVCTQLDSKESLSSRNYTKHYYSHVGDAWAYPDFWDFERCTTVFYSGKGLTGEESDLFFMNSPP